MKLDWLDDGNLFLLLPDCLLEEWHGIDSSDYHQACAGAEQWLNLLPVGSGVGLVLGGDPGMTLVVPRDAGEALLVRWLYADDEEDLLAFALHGEAAAPPESELVFENPVEQWRLFDAAANPKVDRYSWRRVTLPVGRVRARTAYVQSPRQAAVVHRFSPAA